MAFDATDNVSVKEATKKIHWDQLLDNTKANRDLILGDNAQGSGESGHDHDGTNGIYVKLAHRHIIDLIHPYDYNDLYRSAWFPAWFNQRWGGGFGSEYRIGNADGTYVWFETGYIEHDGDGTVGDAANGVWRGQAFKLGQACTIQAVWLKLYKVGNPQKDAEPFLVYICPDNGGEPDEASPSITFTTINGHDLTSSENWPITGNSDGEWYRFAGDSAALSANTTYWVVTKTAGQDGANHFKICTNNSKAPYPHADSEYQYGDDATPTNWLSQANDNILFLIEATEAGQFLQSGGQFGGDHKKMKFVEGNPLNQSQLLVKELRHMKGFNRKEGTIFLTTEAVALTASKTLLDINMGALDHDRIVLVTDGDFHLNLHLYESDGTLHEITDGSTAFTSATKRVICVAWKAMGDGSDFLYLTVGGSDEGIQLTSKTITFDDNFGDLGVCYVGGGFPLKPTWDNEEDFSDSPTNNGWTYIDDHGDPGNDEANRFSFQNGYGYQNANGVDNNTDYNYYREKAEAFSNGNGWLIQWRNRIISDVNTTGELACRVQVADGSKHIAVSQHEYYSESIDGATNYKHQIDQTDKLHIHQMWGKGSDWYYYVDGQLAIDGTGLMTTADANNQVDFGDVDATANSNADVVWDYVKYDEDISSPGFGIQVNGCTLSEVAFFSCDMSTLDTQVYNSGTPVSIKDLCGIKNNYVKDIKLFYRAAAISADPTTTSTSYTTQTDMEFFGLFPNANVKAKFEYVYRNSNAGNYGYSQIHCDGKSIVPGPGASVTDRRLRDASNDYENLSILTDYFRILCGLHNFKGVWKVDGNTGTAKAKRILIAETMN